MNITAYLISLGCPKNRVDSERIAGELKGVGIDLIGNLDDADVAVVNTCGFLATAREEGREVLDELRDWREHGENRRIVVVGCWPKYNEIQGGDPVPWADAVVVGHDPREVAQACLGEGALPRKETGHPIRRLLTTPPSYAYLSLSEGCDRHCTYCAIPKIRGPLKSRSMESIVTEARDLLAAGVRELVLIAQDVSSYGSELAPGGNQDLYQLLRRMDRLQDDEYWLRLLYCHPDGVDERLISLYQELDHLVPYLDIPLQHLSPTILKSMGRRKGPEEIMATVKDLARIPNMTLRTTLMVGFPGETDKDFEALCSFVREGIVQHVGVFSYIVEPVAPAARFPGAVPEEIKEERAEALLNLAEEAAEARHQCRIGEECRALVDCQEEETLYQCRSTCEAPEIDPYLLLESTIPLQPAQFLDTKIIAATSTILTALPIPPLGNLTPPWSGAAYRAVLPPPL